MARRRTEKLRVRGERVLRLRHAHRIVPVARLLVVLDLRAHLAVGRDVARAINLRGDRFHLVPQRRRVFVHELEVARGLAETHHFLRHVDRTLAAFGKVTRVNDLHAEMRELVLHQLHFRRGVFRTGVDGYDR